MSSNVLIQRENNIQFLLQNDNLEAKEILQKFTNRPITRSASANINSWIDYRLPLVQNKVQNLQKIRRIKKFFQALFWFRFFSYICIFLYFFVFPCISETHHFTNETKYG